MEGCQGSGAGTDFVDLVVEIRDAVIDVVNGFRVGRNFIFYRLRWATLTASVSAKPAAT